MNNRSFHARALARESLVLTGLLMLVSVVSAAPLAAAGRQSHLVRAIPRTTIRTTYYVDGQLGNDSNPGTATAPWQSIEKATTTVQPGDKVLVAAGIYRIPDLILVFEPAGLDSTSMTIFKAKNGGRVIVTGPNDEPIQVAVKDYVHVEGFWFGGISTTPTKRIISVGGQPIGRGQEVVHNTIFGYNTGVLVGAGEQSLIQDNRFVNNATDKTSAAIYISSGLASNGALTQHEVVDHNIVIGGAGYGVQGWHAPRNIIYSRNFIASHFWGSAFNGTDSLFANNFYWQEKGTPTLPPFGPLIGTYPNTFMNNIFGPHGWINVANAGVTFPHLTFANNAFTDEPWPLGIGGNTCKTPCGTGGVKLVQGQELQQLGITTVTLNNAIAALRTSFSQSISAIYADTTIEPNFAIINQMQIPSGSRLYQTGFRWTGQPINIGTDAPAPADFWAAFDALGFAQWDRFGNLQ